MLAFPDSLGWANIQTCSPTRKGGICRYQLPEITYPQHGSQGEKPGTAPKSNGMKTFARNPLFFSGGCTMGGTSIPPVKRSSSDSEKGRFSLCSVSTPIFLNGWEQCLHAEPPAPSTWRVWVNRLYNWVHGCPGVAVEPGQHPCTLWMCLVIRLGRMEVLNIGTPFPQKRTWGTFF